MENTVTTNLAWAADWIPFLLGAGTMYLIILIVTICWQALRLLFDWLSGR